MFPDGGRTDAHANTMMSLANSRLYVNEIERVIVSSISLEQCMGVWFFFLNYQAYKELFSGFQENIAISGK